MAKIPGRYLKFVKVVPYNNVASLLEALDNKKITISEKVLRILAKMDMPDRKSSLQLYSASARNLGFTFPVGYESTVKRAVKYGYELCPQITAPFLAMSYPSHLLISPLTVVSDLIRSDSQNVILEVVFKGGKICLQTRLCVDETPFDPATTFVFLG